MPVLADAQSSSLPNMTDDEILCARISKDMSLTPEAKGFLGDLHDIIDGNSPSAQSDHDCKRCHEELERYKELETYKIDLCRQGGGTPHFEEYHGINTTTCYKQYPPSISQRSPYLPSYPPNPSIYPPNLPRYNLPISSHTPPSPSSFQPPPSSFSSSQFMPL